MALSIGRLLGLNASGDIGDYTVYVDRYQRFVVFPRSPPECPATPNQLRQRARFRWVMEQWAAEPLQVRLAWSLLSDRTDLHLLGHNTYMHFAFSQDQYALDTLIMQSGVNVAMPLQPPYDPTAE